MNPSLAWLTDPTVFAVNRLPARSDHVWRVDGRLPCQSLDGEWRFAFSPSPDARPAGFYMPGADLSAFGPITVPGHIETQGHGQLQYVNVMYPWDGRYAPRPPQIPGGGVTVGSYVKDFLPDPCLRGRTVTLRFEGVEQAFYCWCNGQFVGYSEDSFTPAEFDLTPFLREGPNRLCVEVYRHSSAAWIEDQDFFRFSGIFRPVCLWGSGPVHLEDLWLQAGLEPGNAAGTLAPRLRLRGAAAVHCRVTAPDGAVVYDAPLALHAQGEYLYADPIRLPGVRPWHHGDPALYRVTLSLLDGDGLVRETVDYHTGFRRFEMKDGVMCLNGERVVFNGVNRHEWNPETGRAIGPGDMRRAMDTLRRNHINAVRTCHYPDQGLWYDLCDQNGIYMIDEANLESHGSWQKLTGIDPAQNVPGSLPEWEACVVDRARSMFERDKNHTAVLIWSCGNESYAGEGILAMSRFFHENDPSRLVHYEGVVHNRAFDAISDMESRMYATPGDIRAYLLSKPEKPLILCEYMHDMGNSLGGMESYIRLAQEFPQYQGGFIWDYMDQALWRTDAAGRRVLGYGGDFGERPTDYAFCANGIVFADGTEKPAMQEVRYWYQDADARAAFDAANAHAARADALDLARRQAARDDEGRARPGLAVTRGDMNLGVGGNGFHVLFSYTEGGPVSLEAGGRQWLYRAPRPVFWRATTENDKGNRFAANSAAWMAADALCRCTGCDVEQADAGRVCVAYRFECPAVPGAVAELRYTVTAGGDLVIQARYRGAPGLPELPCFGFRLTTPRPVQRVEWTGLSGETYPDRYKGGVFGRHAEAPHLPAYLVPQDCGCHVGTHRLRLCALDPIGQGRGALELVMDGSPFAFSALPHTALELEAADHREDLGVPAHTHLCVYAAMRGVGGIDSWGADVEAPWHVSGQASHEVTVRVRLA